MKDRETEGGENFHYGLFAFKSRVLTRNEASLFSDSFLGLTIFIPPHHLSCVFLVLLILWVNLNLYMGRTDSQVVLNLTLKIGMLRPGPWVCALVMTIGPKNNICPFCHLNTYVILKLDSTLKRKEKLVEVGQFLIKSLIWMFFLISAILGHFSICFPSFQNVQTLTAN